MNETEYFAPGAAQVIDRAGWATTAMVLGIIGVVMSFIPIVGLIAFVLCPLAIIFGVLSRRSSQSGQATAGLVCGLVGLCVSIAWAILFSATMAATSSNLNHLNEQTQSYNACVSNAGSDVAKLNTCWGMLTATT